MGIFTEITVLERKNLHKKVVAAQLSQKKRKRGRFYPKEYKKGVQNECKQERLSNLKTEGDAFSRSPTNPSSAP